jgi:hypothetical protein
VRPEIKISRGRFRALRPKTYSRFPAGRHGVPSQRKATPVAITQYSRCSRNPTVAQGTARADKPYSYLQNIDVAITDDAQASVREALTRLENLGLGILAGEKKIIENIQRVRRPSPPSASLSAVSTAPVSVERPSPCGGGSPACSGASTRATAPRDEAAVLLDPTIRRPRTPAG